MPSFIYDILTSPIFFGFVVLWLIIVIVSQEQGREYISRMNTLLRKPSIFTEDTNPNETIPLYVHAHTVAVSFRDWMERPFQGLIDLIRTGLSFFTTNVKDATKPFLFVGYFFSFVLLAIYIYIDAIGVIIILINAGFISSESIPDVFEKFEFVAIGGSLFALLVGFYILAQITRKPSEFSRWDKQEGPWKRIAKALTYILIFLGFFAIIFLALELMVTLGYFAAQGGFINGLVDFSSVVLTRINSVLASILLFEDGFMGLVLVLIILLAFLWGVFMLLQSLTAVIGKVLPVILNFAHRVILWVLFTVWFLITAPIFWFMSLFKRL